MTSLKGINILHSPYALTTQSECPFFTKLWNIKETSKKGAANLFFLFFVGFQNEKIWKVIKILVFLSFSDTNILTKLSWRHAKLHIWKVPPEHIHQKIQRSNTLYSKNVQTLQLSYEVWIGNFESPKIYVCPLFKHFNLSCASNMFSQLFLRKLTFWSYDGYLA